MTITLDDIRSAETAMQDVRDSLNAMGRDIFHMRNGEKLGTQYGFDGYSMHSYVGEHYEGQEGPDWGAGTLIVSLRYYWSRAESAEVVTFPQSYLGADWRPIEQSRLDRERQILAEEKARADAEELLQREIAERQIYEELRAKFG